VRLRWSVESAGWWMATSAHWLPPGTPGGRGLADRASCACVLPWEYQSRRARAGGLWEDLVRSSAFARAPVVVLLLGAMDGARHSTVGDAAATGHNVALIAQSLARD